MHSAGVLVNFDETEPRDDTGKWTAGGTAALKGKKGPRATWHGHGTVLMVRHAYKMGLSKEEIVRVLPHLGIVTTPTTIAAYSGAAEMRKTLPELTPEHHAEFTGTVFAVTGRIPTPRTAPAPAPVVPAIPALPATPVKVVVPHTPPPVAPGSPVVPSETHVAVTGGHVPIKKPSSFSAFDHAVVHVDLGKVLERMEPGDYTRPKAAPVDPAAPTPEEKYAAKRYGLLAEHVGVGGSVTMPEAEYVTGHGIKLKVGKATIALLRDRGATTIPFVVPITDKTRFSKAFELGRAKDAAALERAAGVTAEDGAKPARPAGSEITAGEYYTAVALPYAAPAETKRVAEAHLDMGVYPSEKSTKAEEKLKTLMTTAHMFRRVSSKDFASVLRDGRFKSQFETGTSGGAFDPTMRKEAEAKGLGAPKELAPEKRPIYGYMHGASHGGSEVASEYGDIKVRLKPALRPRTTFTVGDSLGGFHAGRVAGVPVNAPTVHGVSGGYMFERLEEAKHVHEVVLWCSYVETQYHGGVTVNDFDAVIVGKAKAKSETFAWHREKLEELGIPIEIHGA